MPATEKINIKKLGILAGAGLLPEQLIQSCKKNDIEVFVVGFIGQTPEKLKQGNKHLWTGLGSVGQIFKTLRAENIKDIVFAGSIKRPSLFEIKPDFKGLEILTKIGLKSLGDNELLTNLKNELHAEGFTVHGAHEFAQDMIAKEGILGAYEPQPKDTPIIKKGIEIAHELGRLDIGQAVVLQQDLILGLEAIEGTDELIKRCKTLKKSGRGPVLVKMCKPQQDKALDLPTIGPDTIKNAINSGFCGIVIQAKASIVLNAQEIADLADKNGLFVLAIDPETYQDQT